MSVNIEETEEIMSLNISGDFTIYTALEYHNAIKEKFSVEKNLEIDLSEVEEIDGSGLQILTAMGKEFVNSDSTMNITAMSNVVQEALETSQVLHDLNCTNIEV